MRSEISCADSSLINKLLGNPTAFSVEKSPRRTSSTVSSLFSLRPCRLTQELINNIGIIGNIRSIYGDLALCISHEHVRF